MGRTTVYNDNLTQDYDKVSEKNKKLVKDFLKYCRSIDRSPQTIHQYEEWLKVFFCWNYAENEDQFFIDLKKRDFVYYFGWCRDLGMSTNRIASLKSVLSSLSSEIELLYEDVYPNFHNQLRGLEPVHITTVREKTVLKSSDINKILEGLVENKEYQIACYLALLCASGCRKSEMLQMKPEYFTEDHEVFDGYMYCTPPIRSKGRGKVGKIIKKYVIKEFFKPFFDLWMKQREELGIECEYLFVTKRGGVYVPANTTTANGFAAYISKMYKIDYYSHSGRHYFCTLLKSMELPDDVIVQIFSWSSPDMLKIYDDTPAEERLSKFFIDFSKKEVKGE